MTSPGTVYGIDLGTTFSAIAYVDEFGQPRVLMNRENTAVTPSVVYFESPQNVIVGQPARESGRIDPQNFVELIKRCMGDKDYRRTIHGQDYRPEQLSAFILKKLKEDAEALLGCAVTDVVITVPAYFNEAQRTATEQAGIVAGLKVRGVIPEPTAAAVAYAATETDSQTLMVYDLGGGTFDVTVMQVQGSKVRVVCIDGDHDLGGRNWDEKVVAYLADEWKSQSGAFEDPLGDLETQQELFKQAEEAKRLLTNRQKTPIKVSHAGQSVRVELTREHFDSLTADLLERTMTLARQAMAEAVRQGVAKIDKILLVGGSSYMPQVQSRLQQEFAGVEQQLFEPEQAVAKGAAIYAANKQIQDAYQQVLKEFLKREDVRDVKMETLSAAQQNEVTRRVMFRLPGVSADTLSAGWQMQVINACSKNFGVVALDESDREIVAYLIRRNTAVPAEREEEFYTRSPNQADVAIRIFEADGTSPPESPAHPGCQEIKKVTLNLPPGLAAGHPIRVKFSLSDDGGRLRVQAHDPYSGGGIDETVDTFNALMPQELEELARQTAGVTIG